MTPPSETGGLPNDASADGAPRPKLSRRPASFSRPAAPPLNSEPLPPPASPGYVPKRLPPGQHQATPAIAWQEDARFGVAMLLVVLLVNVLLVYGLAHLPDHTGDTAAMQVTAKASPMPQAIGNDNSVTIYAQPEEERRTIQQLDLRHNDGGSLSVSPEDMPTPTARALDEGDQ